MELDKVIKAVIRDMNANRTVEQILENVSAVNVGI